MAVFRPFKALRPQRDIVDKVISLPYDVMNREEAYKMAIDNPLSFLHVTRAEIDLPESTDAYDESVYKTSKENLNRLVEDGFFYRENTPVFMIYRITYEGYEQTGFVGCVSVSEYESGVVRRHELTRVEKEEDRIRHFETCRANTEPVFLTYRNEETLGKIIENWTSDHEADFVTETSAGVGHAVWTVNDLGEIDKIREAFEDIERLYIADGHHRSASAFKTGLSERAKNPEYTGDEEFNYFMAVAFPRSQLRILDYNRLVRDIAGKSKVEFVNDISKYFHVEKIHIGQFKPSEEHVLGMYLDDSWYELRAKDEIFSDKDIIDSLDVNLLQNYILGPILGINDPRVDDRLEFVGGIRGLTELEKRVREGMAVAFALYPVSVSTLLEVADRNLIMPPKSTWFEPKLGSGLFIHEI